MTAQDYANILCLIAAAITLGVWGIYECNRNQWSQRR